MDNDGCGLLWFDDSTRTLPEKIAAAMARFCLKWGTQPGVVRVHRPSLDPDKAVKQVDGIPVKDGIGPPFHLFVTSDGGG